VDISHWFLENVLLLNPTKTEVVLFGARAQHVNSGGLSVTGAVVL